ncbi:hypothetical protein [Streptomyces sp. NPDC051704]|uniref:hypothetical protein n=1 Tax=Streptomyces sp. NPDC051704 TaxID=3365671 RepID=UPI00378A3CC3
MVFPGGLLPPIGLEIPCAGYAVDVPMKFDALGLVTLDFKGGIRVRVEANMGGFGGVKLRIIGEQYSANHPTLGIVTLSQADIDTTPLSLLEVLSNMPPKFKNTLFHDFTLTIEKPPGGGGAPLVLSNTKTMTTLNDSLTIFPPQGAVYQLQQPVEFAPVGEPSKVVAQLLQFPMTMSHNA